jgi:hypothetical protein
MKSKNILRSSDKETAVHQLGVSFMAIICENSCQENALKSQICTEYGNICQTVGLKFTREWLFSVLRYYVMPVDPK